MNGVLLEVIGYTGMALVLISFLMKDIKWVRIVNMSGAILSLIYGIFTRTIPTACLNGALFVINGVFVFTYFRKEKKKKLEANTVKENETKTEE